MGQTPDYTNGYHAGYERGLADGRRELRKEIQALRAKLRRRRDEDAEAVGA